MKTRIRTRAVIVGVCLLFGSLSSLADELRPAYIEFTEKTSDIWTLLWKASERSILGRSGSVLLPDNCKLSGAYQLLRTSGNLIQTAEIRCKGSIEQKTTGLLGLENSTTDALVRIKPLDAEPIVLRLTPNKNRAEIPIVQQGIGGSVALAYLELGIEHILEGYDHLLFVIGLVLLLTGWKNIALTVTAFTVAHSITLVGTTLGLLSLPQKPVEAIIALSIVFLAVEIAKSNDGHLRFSQRVPWLIAFIFGLLHGFGFADALAEIGLPRSDVAIALLSFNLGVEIGQLIIVSIALFILFLLSHRSSVVVFRTKSVSAYIIGSTSMFWLIDRVFN